MSSLTSRIERQVRDTHEKKRKERDSKIQGFYIPRTEEWNDLAKRSRWENIHRLDQAMVQSGSNTTDVQFLSYRTIYSPRQDRHEFQDKMQAFGITNRIWQAAGEVVSQSSEFNRFISVMEARNPIEDLNERDEDWPGSWVSIKSFQEAIESPGRIQTRSDNEAMLRAAKNLVSSFAQEVHGFPGFSSEKQDPYNKRRVLSGRATVFQVSQWPSTSAMQVRFS